MGPEVVIPARRNWPLLVVVPLWLGLWTSGMAGVAGEIRSGRARGGEAGFFELWLVMAVAGSATVVYAWLRNAIGREVVGLRPGALVIRRDVAGLGFNREYSLADVRNLRVSVPPSDAGRWVSPICFGRDPGVLAFDHGTRTVRFGEGLEEAEASLVLAELGAREAVRSADPEDAELTSVNRCSINRAMTTVLPLAETDYRPARIFRSSSGFSGWR